MTNTMVALPPFEAVNSFFDPNTYESACLIIRSNIPAKDKLVFVMLLSLAAGIQNMQYDDNTPSIITPDRPN